MKKRALPSSSSIVGGTPKRQAIESALDASGRSPSHPAWGPAAQSNIAFDDIDFTLIDSILGSSDIRPGVGGQIGTVDITQALEARGNIAFNMSMRGNQSLKILKKILSATSQRSADVAGTVTFSKSGISLYVSGIVVVESGQGKTETYKNLDHPPPIIQSSIKKALFSSFEYGSDSPMCFGFRWKGFVDNILRTVNKNTVQEVRFSCSAGEKFLTIEGLDSASRVVTTSKDRGLSQPVRPLDVSSINFQCNLSLTSDLLKQHLMDFSKRGELDVKIGDDFSCMVFSTIDRQHQNTLFWSSSSTANSDVTALLREQLPSGWKRRFKTVDFKEFQNACVSLCGGDVTLGLSAKADDLLLIRFTVSGNSTVDVFVRPINHGPRREEEEKEEEVI